MDYWGGKELWIQWVTPRAVYSCFEWKLRLCNLYPCLPSLITSGRSITPLFTSNTVSCHINWSDVLRAMQSARNCSLVLPCVVSFMWKTVPLLEFSFLWWASLSPFRSVSVTLLMIKYRTQYQCHEHIETKKAWFPVLPAFYVSFLSKNCYLLLKVIFWRRQCFLSVLLQIPWIGRTLVARPWGSYRVFKLSNYFTFYAFGESSSPPVFFTPAESPR